MTDDLATGVDATANGGGTPLMIFDPAIFDQKTPDYLIPKMDQFPVSDPAYYKQLVVLDPRKAPAGASEIEAPLDPFAPLDEQATPDRPLMGVLFTYEQAWRQRGLALGQLVHSLCLAPGEVTKVAVVDFSRRTTSVGSDAASQSDTVASSTDQGSAVFETKKATAEEASAGTSTQFATSTQRDAGVAGGGLLFGGSASTSTATGFGVSTASSASSSSMRASGAKLMQQTTVAASQAVRSRRSTQVREVSESETQTATTRVIANYNHMHAMTMLFFEVVQVFALSTRAVDAERVVFLPMKAVTFTEETVRAQSSRLLEVLYWTGLREQHDQLKSFLDKDTAPVRIERMVAQARLREAVGRLRSLWDKARAETIELDPPDGYMIQLMLRAFDFELQHHIERDGEQAVMAEKGVPEAIAARNDVAQAFQDYLEADAAYDKTYAIVAFLEQNRLWFNQQLWMRLSPAHVQRLVAKHTVDRTPLANLMDPRPLGIHGNYVAFRLPHGTSGGDASFRNRYVHQPGEDVPEDFVALPSGGVFGEAVLGEAISAEKIDLTRFWNWQDSPIPILPPSMQPVDMASRARDVAFSSPQLDAALAEILEPELPDGVALDGIIANVKSTLGDMSRSGELQALLAGQTAATQAGSAAAGDRAVQHSKNVQDFAVGLANSELAKAAVKAVALKSGGAASATVLGGVLGGSRGKGGSGDAR